MTVFLHNVSTTQMWDSSVPEQTATQKIVYCSQSAGEIWNWQENDQSDLEARKSFSWRGALLLDRHQGTTRKGKWEKVFKSGMQWNLLFWTPPYSEHLPILSTFLKTRFNPIDFYYIRHLLTVNPPYSELWTLFPDHFLIVSVQTMPLIMNAGQSYGHMQELWWHHMQ